MFICTNPRAFPVTYRVHMDCSFAWSQILRAANVCYNLSRMGNQNSSNTASYHYPRSLCQFNRSAEQQLRERSDPFFIWLIVFHLYLSKNNFYRDFFLAVSTWRACDFISGFSGYAELLHCMCKWLNKWSMHSESMHCFCIQKQVC